MQRKEVTLGKDTVLWEEGDVARDIAVVTRGRLGARTEKGLMGVILPPMVVGESALFGTVRPERRTATLFALEDGTQVRQYPADVVRQALEGGDESLVRQVVNTLVGQICRNLLMVITSRRGYAFIDTPLMSLVREIVHDAQEARAHQGLGQPVPDLPLPLRPARRLRPTSRAARTRPRRARRDAHERFAAPDPALRGRRRAAARRVFPSGGAAEERMVGAGRSTPLRQLGEPSTISC